MGKEDGLGKPPHPHLRLVSQLRTDEELERARLWESLATREFNAGSFQTALERQVEIFRYLSVDGVVDLARAKELAKSKMLSLLRNLTLTIDINSISHEKLADWSLGLTLANVVPQVLYEQGQELEDPSLPERNRQKHFRNFVGYIESLAPIRCSREQIELALAEDGIKIRDSDITRLLIYDINKDLLIPRVLVLPSDYKPYNPAFVLLSSRGDASLPDPTIRMLRLLNR